jgi:predicted lipoprotein with Yx(FWY)xxD motif
VTRTSSRAALALVAMLAVAACGDDDDDDTAAETTTAAAATEAAAATTAAPADTEAAATTTPADTEAPGTTAADGTTPAAGEATVATAESELGTILVDGEGLTLYMFMPDNQGPSSCEGDCLAAWPSLTGPATAGEGVDESLLGTAARPDDGTEQVTYNGWPLYYFAQDSAPGDVNGQGVGDVWFVVDPAGEPIPVS